MAISTGWQCVVGSKATPATLGIPVCSPACRPAALFAALKECRKSSLATLARQEVLGAWAQHSNVCVFVWGLAGLILTFFRYTALQEIEPLIQYWLLIENVYLVGLLCFNAVFEYTQQNMHWCWLHPRAWLQSRFRVN